MSVWWYLLISVELYVPHSVIRRRNKLSGAYKSIFLNLSVVVSFSMESQKILRHKNWIFSDYKLPYLQFLVGWLCHILEQKGLYKQLAAYSEIPARWTVLLGLFSVLSVSVWVTANSEKKPFKPFRYFFCCLHSSLPVCCLLPSAVHVFAWAAVCPLVQWLLATISSMETLPLAHIRCLHGYHFCLSISTLSGHSSWRNKAHKGEVNT